VREQSARLWGQEVRVVGVGQRGRTTTTTQRRDVSLTDTYTANKWTMGGFATVSTLARAGVDAGCRDD